MIKKNNIKLIDELDLSVKFIDLNLPSKILWGDRNFGNNKYYQWGDLRGYYNKDHVITCLKRFDWESYKFFNKETNELDKYNETDKLEKLQARNDIVTLAASGENFRIPEKKDFVELLDNTEQIYNNDSVIFKSRINGNQITFPLLGYINGSCIRIPGSFCIIWSSTLYKDYFPKAYSLFIRNNDKKKLIEIGTTERFYGCLIRPIYDKETKN